MKNIIRISTLILIEKEEFLVQKVVQSTNWPRKILCFTNIRNTRRLGILRRIWRKTANELNDVHKDFVYHSFQGGPAIRFTKVELGISFRNRLSRPTKVRLAINAGNRKIPLVRRLFHNLGRQRKSYDVDVLEKL